MTPNTASVSQTLQTQTKEKYIVPQEHATVYCNLSAPFQGRKHPNFSTYTYVT